MTVSPGRGRQTAPFFFMSILSVSNLRKVYGGTLAVDDLSFSTEPGEIVGLLGPNGAGKTTTINMILGVLEPSGGEIQIDRYNLSTARREALLRTNFAAVYAPLPGNLTVVQNLTFFGMLYSVPSLGHRISALLEQFDLGRFRHTKCGVLSSGEQTRVSLAKAMLNEPRLLLLDEPSAGLAPVVVQQVFALVERIRASGLTVLIVEQNVRQVLRVVDRAYLLEAGRIKSSGNAAELLQSGIIQEAYLGI